MAPNKILIIDDDPMTRRVFSGFLTGEGYSVTAVSGGREALLILSDEIPDMESGGHLIHPDKQTP